MPGTEIARRVREVVEFASRGRAVTLTESHRGGDVLIGVEAGTAAKHVLTVRLQEGGALVDVDGSEALDFAAGDAGDVADLLTIVGAFCSGELEGALDERDGKYHSFRVGDLSWTVSRAVFRRGRPRRPRQGPVNLRS